MKILVVLLWPAGIIAILLVTRLLAKRTRQVSAPVAEPGYETGDRDTIVALRAARSSIIGMLLILVVGAVAVYTVTCLLGVFVVHVGPSIDKPLYAWMTDHRVHFWKAFMEHLTTAGNTWTTRIAAVAAAVCLAAFYRKDKWLPPVALGAAILIENYLTLALRHTFHRTGPPDSPFSTYPSGGCDQTIVLYGLIAYLIWREVSGRKSTAIWSAGIVAALGFSEGYSCGYLTLHWFTEIICGLIYGFLILAVFIVTIRLVAGQGSRAEAADVPADLILAVELAADTPALAPETADLAAETTDAQFPTLQ